VIFFEKELFFAEVSVKDSQRREFVLIFVYVEISGVFVVISGGTRIFMGVTLGSR